MLRRKDTVILETKRENHLHWDIDSRLLSSAADKNRYLHRDNTLKVAYKLTLTITSFSRAATPDNL